MKAGALVVMMAAGISITDVLTTSMKGVRAVRPEQREMMLVDTMIASKFPKGMVIIEMVMGTRTSETMTITREVSMETSVVAMGILMLVLVFMVVVEGFTVGEEVEIPAVCSTSTMAETMVEVVTGDVVPGCLWIR